LNTSVKNRRQNPNLHENAPVHPVWCALLVVGIVCAEFLEENVNSERYGRFGKRAFFPFLQKMA
jgi:hypothetical protein